MIALVAQGPVDLVGDQPEVPRSRQAHEGVDGVLRQDPPGGIARRIDQDRPGPRGDGRGDTREIQLIAGMGGQLDRHHFGSAGRHHRGVGGIVGGQDDHLVPGAGNQLEQREQRALCPGTHSNLRRQDLDAVEVPCMAGNGRSQGRFSAERRIVGPARFQRLDRCGQHGRVDVHVRVPDAEVDDVPSLGQLPGRAIPDVPGRRAGAGNATEQGREPHGGLQSQQGSGNQPRINRKGKVRRPIGPRGRPGSSADNARGARECHAIAGHGVRSMPKATPPNRLRGGGLGEAVLKTWRSRGGILSKFMKINRKYDAFPSGRCQPRGDDFRRRDRDGFATCLATSRKTGQILC